MSDPAKWAFRMLFMAMVVATASALVVGAAGAGGYQVSGSNENITVVTGHSYEAYPSKLVAFQNGSVIYESTRFDRYHDVDPVEGERATVEYVATSVPGEVGNATGTRETVGVYKTNLTTNETWLIWEQTFDYTEIDRNYTRGIEGRAPFRYHDVDRINKTHLLVADILKNRAFIVDTETDNVTWSWNATERYPRSAGGKWQHDWTHINDVEMLGDGRIMVSVRNMDEVVFIKPGEGVTWSLGSDDNHGVLYEQHNPDYIPPERGGPAVIVADSENNRVVEYHRIGSEWVERWSYTDEKMAWPRDADRLPNGNTLIADSNGNRVIEVTPSGEIVWSTFFPTPYDVERIGTGDESAGGPALIESQLNNSSAPSSGGQVAKAMNGVLFVTPAWFGVGHLLLLAGTVVAFILMVGYELLRYATGGSDAGV